MIKRFSIIILCLALFLTACGKSTVTPTWQEQYDLGMRYLSEGNYEEAIIAFTAAIEIDPKQPQAYEKLADTYIYLNDLSNAIRILEEGVSSSGDANLQEKLNSLIAAPEEPESSESLSVISETGTAELSASGNDFVLSMDVPNLKSSYWVNQPEIEPDRLECCWLVSFTDGVNTYEVGTSHFNRLENEDPKEMTLYDMQSNVWLRGEDGTTYISDAELEISGTTLCWLFSIPEEYGFDAANMQILEEIVDVIV